MLVVFSKYISSDDASFLMIRNKNRLLYFIVYDAHFFAQIFEGKIRMCII